MDHLGMSYLTGVGAGTAQFSNTVFGGLAGLFLSNQVPAAPAFTIAQNQPSSDPNSTQRLPYVSHQAAYVDPNKASLAPCDSNPEHKYCGKDAKHVYIYGYELQGADPDTFLIRNNNYAKDRNSFFYIRNLIEGCGDIGPVAEIDSKTYNLLPGNTSYAKDKNRYFSGASPIVMADTSTFVVINDCYAKDVKEVFYGSEPIIGADPNSFMPIAGYACWYSKDANHVYIRGQTGTFGRPTTDCLCAWADDAKQVYFYRDALPNADPNNFVALNGRYGKDTTHAYIMNRLITGVDIPSLVGLREDVWYATDKNHVYHVGKVIQGAGPETFTPVDTDQSCGPKCIYRTYDKNHKYDYDDKAVP